MPLLYESTTLASHAINTASVEPHSGLTQLSLEIKSTAMGFYASIYSKQQLISQTQIFKTSSKATQEGYRQIDCFQHKANSVKKHALFN